MSLENESYEAAQLSEELPKIDIESETEKAQDPGGFFDREISFNWLKAKTGAGSIEDYMIHPLNVHESKGTAQILRGCTGIAGDLDLAILDIGLGVIELVKEKRIGKKPKGVNDYAIISE